MSPKHTDRERQVLTRASEVGQYGYCARAWWLGTVQGVRPGNVSGLQAGQAKHRRHGRQVVAYHRLRSVGYVLVVAALILAALAYWILARG